MVCKTCELVKDILQVASAVGGTVSGANPAGWVNLLAPGGPLGNGQVESQLADELRYELMRRVNPPAEGPGVLAGMDRGSSRFSYEAEMEKPKKKKAKVSRYHRTLGKHLEKLKKAHPRTAQKKLMKKAHAATKAQRKREGW